METMKEIGISWLYENRTVRKALHPNFAITVDEVHTFSDVPACCFDYWITINVWKLSQTKSVGVRSWIRKSEKKIRDYVMQR